MAPATEADRRYANDLRRAVNEHALELPENPAESELSWHGFNEELRACVNERDPREFLLWNVIRKSMFVSNPRYVAQELRYLKARSDWKARWKKAIEEAAIGRPRPYPRYPRSSGNLIHHAYSVARFEEAIGEKVNDLSFVFEFGGGYGSMARLFANLEFTGRYSVYDFPYFSALQRFFLRSIGLPAHDGVACAGRPQVTDSIDICCMSDLESLQLALASEKQDKGRLFLATWSISEAPLSVRREIMSLVRDFDFFLIAFQHQFEEIDNRAFFHEWTESMGRGYEWQWLPMEHLPGNSYLFGKRSD